MTKKIINLLLFLFAIYLSLICVSAQTEQKAELVVPLGHPSVIKCAAFSPNGQLIVTGDKYAGILILWNVSTGKELRRFTGNFGGCLTAIFSNDGNFIASLNDDRTLRKWDVQKGQELLNVKISSETESITFTEDDKRIITGSLQIYDSFSAKEIDSAIVGEKVLAFNKTGRYALILSKKKGLEFWNLTSGICEKKFEFNKDSNLESVYKMNPDTSKMTAAFSQNEEKVIFYLSGGYLGLVSLDISTGETHQETSAVLKASSDLIFKGEVFLFKDEVFLYPCSDSICSFNYKSAKQIPLLSVNAYIGYGIKITKIISSPDSKYIAAVNESDGTVTIWNYFEKKAVSWLIGKFGWVKIINFDGNHLQTTNEIKGEMLWNLSSGQTTLIEKGGGKGIGPTREMGEKILVSPNRLFRIQSSVLYDKSGNKIANLVHDSETTATNFSSDSKFVGVGYFFGGICLWDTQNGALVKVFSGHQSMITNLKFSADGSTLITASADSTIRFWDINSGKEKVKLMSSFDGDWIVTTPDGLFDASPSARKLMYYVIGLESISLEQMKDLYYVPGLLQKVMKNEPLPKVELFSQKDLFPEVEFSPPKEAQTELPVKLTNRGGGIGQVQILINGKEFINDIRPPNFNVNAKEPVLLTVNLKDAPFISGADNKIEVIARNAEGSLTNRGTPKGSVSVKTAGNNTNPNPQIYVIAGGVSDYTGDGLDLTFAAKDAEDVAKAIEIGAIRLLGDKSKVHLRLLTSNGDKSTAKFEVPDSKITTATKDNFKQAFSDFKNATSNDVFIVYLSGHGVSLNLNQNPSQAGGDTYLYLTQEASTTDKSVLSIENSRKAMTISSEELKELMKQNKSLKQVLILDTCAAGALSNSLIGKRDLPSDQIRAIERLKDNTGFYVLMGSSANAVSYEASQYGQGLLTYSLLQGMKGAKLRENQFADIGLLFGYAQDMVPQMAKNIGGIQRPLIITPDTSNSFDIGKFTIDEQKLINLSNPKPIILRPNLQNKELDYDDLELTKLLQEKLREANYVSPRGGNNPLVFVEADEMVDAIKPSGSYSVKGDEITVTIRLIKNKAPIKTLTVTGKTGGKSELIQTIIKGIIESAPTN